MGNKIFLDSENCILDGKRMSYFKHSNNLIYDINNALREFGAEAIFSSPKKEIKFIRESIAEYFFISALKKDTKKDWFIMQPKNDPPDFWLMTFGENSITMDPFELVEIPEHFKDFKQMFDVIKSKVNKRYSEKYNLLIFVNNINSSEWVKSLHENLLECSNFKTVWTIKLLQNKSNKNIHSFIINRIRPLPLKCIKTSFDDNIIFKYSPAPNYIEEKIIEGRKFLIFKPDFARDLSIKIRKFNLNRNKILRRKNHQNL